MLLNIFSLHLHSFAIPLILHVVVSPVDTFSFLIFASLFISSMLTQLYLLLSITLGTFQCLPLIYLSYLNVFFWYFLMILCLSYFRIFFLSKSDSSLVSLYFPYLSILISLSILLM